MAIISHNHVESPTRSSNKSSGRAQKQHPDAVDMFAVNRMIRRSDLPYAAKCFLCAILEHDRYGQSERGCIASLETLAVELGCQPRYLTKLLPLLLEGRWVTEERDGKHRPLRLGPHIRETMNPVQTDLGAQCTSVQLGDAPPSDRACTSVQQDRVSQLEVTSEPEFAGESFASLPEDESSPRILRFPRKPAASEPPPPASPQRFPQSPASMARARLAMAELGRRDRILRTDGVMLWIEHRDPENPSSRTIPGWLGDELRTLKPELLALLASGGGP